MQISQKEQTFKHIFAENYPRLYHYALYIVKDSDIAKDLVNDVFVSLWEVYDETQTINAAYLYNKLRYKCIDYLRHAEVHNKYAELYIKVTEEMPISDESEYDERLDIIYQTLERLPARTRYIVEECYFNEKKYSEVAEILHISKDGIRKHIMKALSELRKEFSVNYKKGQYPKTK